MSPDFDDLDSLLLLLYGLGDKDRPGRVLNDVGVGNRLDSLLNRLLDVVGISNVPGLNNLNDLLISGFGSRVRVGRDDISGVDHFDVAGG